jgi:hypothetical protein
VYALGEGILSVTDPLRLFRISRRLIADEKLTVFPHGPSPRETAYLTDLSPRWSARLGMRTGGFLPLSRPRLRANGPPIRASSQSSRQSSTRCPFRNRHSGSVKPLIRFFTMLDALSCHRRIITCLLRVPQSEVSGAQ